MTDNFVYLSRDDGAFCQQITNEAAFIILCFCWRMMVHLYIIYLLTDYRWSCLYNFVFLLTDDGAIIIFFCCCCWQSCQRCCGVCCSASVWRWTLRTQGASSFSSCLPPSLQWPSPFCCWWRDSRHSYTPSVFTGTLQHLTSRFWYTIESVILG